MFTMYEKRHFLPQPLLLKGEGQVEKILTAILWCVAFVLFLLLSSVVRAETQRLVVAGGALTEIVYALGAQEQIVGVDTTSTWPSAAQLLPQVGYQRALSAEGVLSLQPDLVLGSDDVGPDTVLAHLREAGVPILQVDVPDTAQGLVLKVKAVAQLVGRKTESLALIASITQQMAQLHRQYGEPTYRPKVAFMLGGGQGSPMMSGSGTSADAAISLAGGRNAFTSYTGYKPLNSEAMIVAAPDVILMTKRTLKAIGGVGSVLSIPGISLTPAGKNARIIAFDGLALLGFGPRTPATLGQLAAQLHRQ